MSKIKGQNLRVFVGDKVVATATSCTFHIAATLEDSSTKDSTGDWQEQEVTGKSWDASCDALVELGSDSSANNTQSLMALMIAGTAVTLSFSYASGDKNRTSGDCVVEGTAYISDISITAANRQNSTYTVQFQGTGVLG